MSNEHRTAEYFLATRAVRREVADARAAGRDISCMRCGRLIGPEQRFDVGHRIDVRLGGTHERSNLGVEHRSCNRRAGGRAGAAVQAQQRQSKGRWLPW